MARVYCPDVPTGWHYRHIPQICLLCFEYQRILRSARFEQARIEYDRFLVCCVYQFRHDRLAPGGGLEPPIFSVTTRCRTVWLPEIEYAPGPIRTATMSRLRKPALYPR